MLYPYCPQRDAAFFYYYWQPSSGPVWENPYHPVVCSIATLRYFCKRVAIYVIDTSSCDTNWGNLPENLSFTVLRRKPFLSDFHVQWDRFTYFSTLVCSKVFDIVLAAQSVPQRKILVSDADIFWVSDPFPFEYNDGFCTDGHNTGFWYYHKDDTKYLGVLLSLLFGSMVSLDMAKCIFEEVTNGSEQGIFLEETVVRFLCSRMPQYNKISSLENYLIPYFFDPLTLAKVKNLHVLGLSQKNRLSIVTKITELADIFDAMFSRTQREAIFGVRPEVTYSCRNVRDMLKLFVNIHGTTAKHLYTKDVKEKWY